MATPVIVTTDTDAEPVVDTSNPQATHVVERDVIVFLARATVTGDVTFEYATEQQW